MGDKYSQRPSRGRIPGTARAGRTRMRCRRCRRGISGGYIVSSAVLWKALLKPFLHWSCAGWVGRVAYVDGASLQLR